MISDIWAGIRDNPELLRIAFLAAVALSLGSLLVVPALVTRIPAGYFAEREAPVHPWRGTHPALWLAGKVIKNVLGAFLLLLGVAMIFLPGQGLLTILVGLMLLDFPGKRSMELSLVRRPRVLRTLNWIRRKVGQEPLEVPAE